MLACAALERRDNSYIESIVIPCVSKNQKEISSCGFDWEGNPEKGFPVC